MRPPRRVLEYHYITKQRTLQEIGSIFGVSKQCVFNWVDYYGLPRRKNGRQIDISRDELKSYIDRGYSVNKIRKLLDVDNSLLWGLLYDYDLYDYYMDTPFSERWIKNLTREELQQIYDSCSIEEAMKKLNCKNIEKFYEILNRYDIKRKYKTHK